MSDIVKQVPSFGRQIGSGLGIFAAIMAVSVPLAFVSEGLALAAAVGLGSVFLALLARRLRVALLIAALLAVLGAFGITHSIRLSLAEGDRARDGAWRLALLAPAAGPHAVRLGGAREAIAIATPVRGELAAAASWAFPAALFALWSAGLAAFFLNRALLRRIWPRLRA